MPNFGCCGMDCDGCEAFKATARGDINALVRIAASQESSGQGSFILPSRVKCTGCLNAGLKSVSCNECRIRMCAMDNGLPHCGFCEEFPCELGSVVWDAIPEYKNNIERLRSR